MDLKYIINLPPEKVQKYFKDKGYKKTWNWDDIAPEAHAKSFTVAKVTKVEILEDIKKALQSAIDEGKPLSVFQKELKPLLKRKGWWGKETITEENGDEKEIQKGSPWRLKTIYRTNLQTAYSVGRYKEFIENVDKRPYWQYIAVMDSKTRPAHAALNGKVFRYDDPFWDTHMPPNGWACRCRIRALSPKEVKERGLKIETAVGKMISKEVPTVSSTQIVSGLRLYDEKSGNFINTWTDPGWNYNPGKIAHQTDLWASGKLKEVQEVLQENYLKDMINSEWHKTAFRNWVKTTAITLPLIIGSTTIAGYVGYKVGKAITTKLKEEIPKLVILDDKRLNHVLNKEKPEQQASMEEIKKLPELISNPDRVFYDNDKKNFLFVKSSKIGERDLKTAVNVIFKKSGIKPYINMISTIGKVPEESFLNPQYEEIWNKEKDK